MEQFRGSGRVLFLSSDPEKIDAQLRGESLALEAALPLRDDVSTDEITPTTVVVHLGDGLGRYPYTGLHCGGRRPIGVDAVRKGGFDVTVAGKRYAKGSSREFSPMAELSAGIRLVIAESFERIYRQNADNLGLFTSTDLSLVERFQRGEAIPVDELVRSRDAVAAAILRAGGLLAYSRKYFQVGAGAAAALPLAGGVPAGPRTLAEKILARHAVTTPDWDGSLVPGAGGFVRADWRFIHDIYTATCRHLLHETFGRPAPLLDPDRILVFEDHMVQAARSPNPAHLTEEFRAAYRRLAAAHREFVAEYGLRAHGVLETEDGAEGICHALITERYALPGQLIVGTDSHTPHAGALGCLAYGVGTTEMANAMVSGVARLTLPETIRVEFLGTMGHGLAAKDLVLHLLAHPAIRSGAGIGKVFEFAGAVVEGLSTDERTTLTNMAAELGGFTGIVAPDEETVRFLRERRGVEFAIEPWMRSDEGARYADVLRIDCGSLEPMVALPGDPGNGVPLRSLSERPAVDIAFGGACTGGKREDFDQYHEVLAWGLTRGLRVAPGVRFYLQFGTLAVREYCAARGYLETFRQAGVELLQPACGACANFGPGSSTRAEQVTVSSINRNFPGRSGPGKVWLASPATVTASALAGELLSYEELRERHAAIHRSSHPQAEGGKHEGSNRSVAVP